MKRLGLVLASAVLFDLGTVVASSHAEHHADKAVIYPLSRQIVPDAKAVDTMDHKHKDTAFHAPTTCVMSGDKLVSPTGQGACTPAPSTPGSGKASVSEITITK